MPSYAVIEVLTPISDDGMADDEAFTTQDGVCDPHPPVGRSRQDGRHHVDDVIVLLWCRGAGGERRRGKWEELGLALGNFE